MGANPRPKPAFRAIKEFRKEMTRINSCLLLSKCVKEANHNSQAENIFRTGSSMGGKEGFAP
jgi:hypothetical protein